jgi:hypothetical protein
VARRSTRLLPLVNETGKCKGTGNRNKGKLFFSAPKCVCGRGGPTRAAGVRVLGVLGEVVSDKRTTCVCLGDKGDKCKHVKKEAGAKEEGD